jgi:hypothetical protein
MTITKKKGILRWLVRIGQRNRISRIAFIVSALSAFSVAAAPSMRKVVIGDYGKLSGAFNGYAWVFGGQETTVASPSPCNSSGCFKDTNGKLCTKGHINALSCTGQTAPQLSCNWDKNWGVVLGLNSTHPQGPWGSSAPARIAVDYSSAAKGGSAGHYRLNAHVVGDPYTKQYCVDNYTPGAIVQAGDFKSQCWINAGDTLPSFRTVDTVGLMRASEFAAVDFDFCVTGISAE